MSKSSDPDRGFIDWSPNARSGPMPDQILSVIQNYRDQGVPAPTVRDVMYEVRSRYGYKKTEAFKRKVYRLLTKMRRVRGGPYKIGFDEIDDDSPTKRTGRGYPSPESFWRGIRYRAQYYSRDLTQRQLQRVIVLTEGAGKVRQFRTVTTDYDIPVFSGGGWESVKFKRDLAQDACEEYYFGSGRPTLAFHCGDFDPDGLEIFYAGIDDVRSFISGLARRPAADPEEIFQVERLMLLPEQAELLPDEDKDFIDRAELKDFDYRGHKWPYDYKCELEALGVRERLEMLRSRIDEVVDRDQLQRVREQGEQERVEIMAEIDELMGG
jgi:hypothetical protein